MKRPFISLVATWLASLVLASSSSGQRISTQVFPSEDEIRQAFEAGEIDIRQYYCLLELSQSGIDTSSTYLLDEIPNLASFVTDHTTAWTELEREQGSAFLESGTTARHGFVRHRIGMELRERGRSQYRTTIRYAPDSHWRVNARINREYTGRERLVERTIEYRNDDAPLSRVRIGSFTERYGLGTVYGYPSCRLSSSGVLTSESLLFPDFGGYNGISAKVRGGSWTGGVLASSVRDDAHRIETVGMTAGRTWGRVSASMISGTTRLVRRDDHASHADSKSALSAAYQYRSGALATEIARQWTGTGGTAAVAEWRHRFEQARFGLALWYYADGYDGILSGSKSGSIARRQEVPETGFSLRDRRNGQTGAYVRTVTQLFARTDFIAGAGGSALSRDSAEIEVLVGITCPLDGGWSLCADYRVEERTLLPTKHDTKRQIRIEPRFADANVRLRTYIAYAHDEDREKAARLTYWSWFARMTVDLHENGKIDLWSNASRIAHGKLEYWYGYVQHEQPLFQSIRVLVKLSHRYQRASAREGYTQFSLQVTAEI